MIFDLFDKIKDQIKRKWLQVIIMHSFGKQKKKEKEDNNIQWWIRMER